ncbi:helix-turn-helix domain-containing protein [Streptomyces sp. NPDC051014]|uniref:helix-turn-helix domain-containing protein n=1 Tax=Streptomyces sp. NPDC051014 TaxID=3155751 RepID=UPI0033C22067
MTTLTPGERRQRDDRIAELLRAGATHAQVQQEIPGVSRSVIGRVRRRWHIPIPSAPSRTLGPERRAAVEERAVKLLRAGTTLKQAAAETGVSEQTILRIRRKYGIPANPKNIKGVSRSVDDGLALHTHASGDHVIWTGPMSGDAPDLYAGYQHHNPRRILFERHHGRAPEGRLARTCEQRACLAGAHHTDLLLRRQRDSDSRADALYDQIFGTEGAAS